MPRYKLTIEYDGSGFVGWQRQANGLSVQEAIETAAAPLGCPPGGVHGAGRTDSGVHATGQVAHLDLAKPYRTDSVRDAINAQLKQCYFDSIEYMHDYKCSKFIMLSRHSSHFRILCAIKTHIISGN